MNDETNDSDIGRFERLMLEGEARRILDREERYKGVKMERDAGGQAPFESELKLRRAIFCHNWSIPSGRAGCGWIRQSRSHDVCGFCEGCSECGMSRSMSDLNADQWFEISGQVDEEHVWGWRGVPRVFCRRCVEDALRIELGQDDDKIKSVCQDLENQRRLLWLRTRHRGGGVPGLNAEFVPGPGSLDSQGRDLLHDEIEEFFSQAENVSVAKKQDQLEP